MRPLTKQGTMQTPQCANAKKKKIDLTFIFVRRAYDIKNISIQCWESCLTDLDIAVFDARTILVMEGHSHFF